MVDSPTAVDRGRRAPHAALHGSHGRSDGHRIANLRLWLLPPLAANIAGLSVMAVAAAISGWVHNTGAFFTPTPWSHWDSGLYLQLASRGYSYGACPGAPFPPHTWCGDVGWMPLYPWLMSLVSHLGLSLAMSGLVLSWIFAYLTMVVVWALIGPAWSFGPLSCLAVAAFFPGIVYEYAVFPMSLFTFGSAAFVLMLQRRRFALAGLAGAVAVSSFASGIVLVAVAGVAMLITEWHSSRRQWVGRTALAAGLPALGFVAVLVGIWASVGSWTAYFKVVHTTGEVLSNPIATFITSVTQSPIPFYWGAPDPAYDYLATKIQTAYIAALVLGVVALALKRRPVSRGDRILVTYALLVWFAPLLTGAVTGRYRLEVALIPCAALALRLPAAARSVMIAGQAVLACAIGVLFFRNILI